MLTVLAALTAFWPRRARHRLPVRRARPARDALRGARGRARLRGRVPARRAAGAARARVPAARAPAPHRGRRGRGARRRDRGRRADRGARARRRRAVVGLRDVGALDRLVALDDVLAGTTTTARWTGRATAARCCASRPSRPPTGRPRASTSSTASAGSSRRRGTREAIENSAPDRPGDPPTASRSRSRSTCATCARARSSPPASRDAPDHAEPRRDPQRPARHLGLEPHAAPRRHLHGSTSTRRSRPSASCAPPAASTTATSTSYRIIELADRPGQNSGTPPGTPGAVVRFQQWDLRETPPEAYRPGFGTVEAEAAQRGPRARALRPVAGRGRCRSGSSAAPATRSTTSSRSRPTSAAASPTPRRRPPSRARSRASCSTRSPATASSTRARWRCCCGWAASPRASPPASPRAPMTARPRSTWCATSTPTRGSRRGSPTTAG